MKVCKKSILMVTEKNFRHESLQHRLKTYGQKVVVSNGNCYLIIMVSGLLAIVMIKWQFSPEMAIFLSKQKRNLKSDWIQNFPIKSRTYYDMISIWSTYLPKFQ